ASVHGVATQLVQEKMVKQQLASDMLNASSLHHYHALSMLKSDSLEIMDFFHAELEKDKATIEALTARLQAMPSDASEEEMMRRIKASSRHFEEVVQNISAFKERGQ